MAIALRPARPADVGFILANIRALAAVEGRPDAVTITEARLGRLLFDDPPKARCVIIEHSGAEPRPVGHAWFYDRIPTFTGEPELYLEDLVIVESARGTGLGRRAMALLAAHARGAGYRGLSWSVVNGNRGAFRFYERLGGVASGSTPFRLDGPALAALAADAEGRSAAGST